MSENLTIEPLSGENFGDFLSLMEKFAAYENLDPPDEESRRRLERDGLSENPGFEAYVGRVSGKAVGYITFFTTYSTFRGLPTLFLEDIFVLAEERRNGLGQKLFDFYLDQARERNCGRAEWCVLDWNEPAIRFYEKNRADRLDWLFYRLDGERLANHPGRSSPAPE